MDQQHTEGQTLVSPALLPTEFQGLNTLTYGSEDDLPHLESHLHIFKSATPKFMLEDQSPQDKPTAITMIEKDVKNEVHLLGLKPLTTVSLLDTLNPTSGLKLKSVGDNLPQKLGEAPTTKSFVRFESQVALDYPKDREYNEKDEREESPRTNLPESLTQKTGTISLNKHTQLFSTHKEVSLINLEVCKIIRDKAVPVEYERTPKKARRKSKNDIKLRKLLHKHANYNDTNARMLFWKVVKMAKQTKTNPFFSIKRRARAIKNSLIGKKESFKKVLVHLLAPSEPDESSRILWNLIVFVFIIYDMVILPFMLAFNQDIIYNETMTTILSITHNSLFILDIILNFKTCYYLEGNLVRDRKDIAIHYLKGWFWLDLITTLPYELIIDTAENNTLRWILAIRLLRIAKLKSLVSRMRISIQNSPMRNGLMSLFKLSLIVFLLAHWCACIWYLIGDNLSTERNWIKEGEYLEDGLGDKYVASLYFTITTMITVGYGDLVPVTTRERLFTIFVMILGGGVFGYTMNSIAIILQSLETESSKLRKKFTTACMYMEKQGISQVVQDEVKKYFEFVLDNESTKKQAEKEALMFLPPHLQNKVLEQINKKFVHNNMVLQNNFSQKALFEIASKVEEKVYSPGEMVFDHKDKDLAFFFVAKGTVGVFSEKSTVPFFYVKKSQHFGEYCFFGNFERTKVARSVNFSHLLFFRRETFVNLLEEFPLDKESFHMIKDKIVLYNDISMLEAKCHVCEGTDHGEHNCPSLFYVPNHQDIIEKYLETKKEMQRDYQRRARKRFSARTNYQELNDKAKTIQEKLPSPISDVSLGSNELDEEIVSPFISEIKLENIASKRSSILKMKRESVKRESIKKLVVKGVTQTGIEVDLYDMVTSLYGNQMSPKGTILLKKLEEQFAEENFEFDRIKNYEIYFPHNNFSKIVDYKKLDYRRKSNLSEMEPLKKHLGLVFKAIEKKEDE